MESREEKQWASKYLLDPLNAPEPSAETGPGTHFDSTFAPATKQEKKEPQATVEEVRPYPSPPDSTLPHRSRFPDFLGASGNHNDRTSERLSTEIPTSSARTSSEAGRRRRGTSLSERYTGDESHRPLDIIRKESLRANRSPHLRRERHHGLDSIDKMGDVGDVSAFHHEGPYDAVSLARNRDPRGAPVAALRESNIEALKATQPGLISDSLRHHRPLDGVAQVPPGVPDRLTGQALNYEEGTDMQRDNPKNRLNQWPGLVDYHPEDRKGKGEPSFSIEKALNGPKHGRYASEGGIEMNERARHSSDVPSNGNRQRAASGTGMATGNAQSYVEWESGLRRSSSARGSRLASKFGSLTRRHRPGSGN